MEVYFLTRINATVDMRFVARMKFDIGKNLEIIPEIGYSWLPDDRITTPEGDRFNWFGLSCRLRL